MTTADRFMAQALRLAALGNGRTASPVGALVVRDGRVVGRGYHPATGQPHAEIHALRQAGELARGADLYVTLEPCCHQGRTPPCTQAVIAAAPARVFVGCLDPNPLVAGRGADTLRQAGLQVVTGVLEARCRRSLEVHRKLIATGLPFVTLKLAQSLDGRVAAAHGESRWISSEPARRLVARWRSGSHAVMVGIGTVLADDPRLTARLPGAHQPVRVVVDAAGRFPARARMLSEPGGPVLVATTAPGAERLAALAGKVELLVLPPATEGVDLLALLKELGRRELASVLVEGGPTLAGSLVRQGLVDKFAFFLAPLLIGGRGALGAVGGPDLPGLDQALRLREMTVRRVGADLLVTAYPDRGQ